MRSPQCDPLKRQGYQFFRAGTSAAVKPCLWCRKALKGGMSCYKHQFYGITSHRCVQMTPTLRCTQRCLFCWRSFEHEPAGDAECPPREILEKIPALQKRALSGYKPCSTPERYAEALAPRHVAISLAGEPTCYSGLSELIDLLKGHGYTTFLVSNGTNPDMLARCTPFQTYVSLCAPDKSLYTRLCRPVEDSWEDVQESLALLGGRRSAIRITLVQGWNDVHPELYAAMAQDSGAGYVEVKGYMYLGYSRNRLSGENMPSHARIRKFAERLAHSSDYRIKDENAASRVVLLERAA
jgi:tRNA wybutosine-synthesizing protein 1